MKFGPEEHARVSAAIASAEAATSGEIFCVFARRVSSHADVVLAWAGALALSLPLLLIPLGFHSGSLPGFAKGWTAGHMAAADLAIGLSLAAYVSVQVLVFAVVCVVGMIPTVRRWMTPRSLRAARCRQAAMAQFLAHGLHVTENRTGVLIFACEADHQVEVIADRNIHEKVGADVWMDTAEALARGMKAGRPAEGYERAVALCGEVLARHFPPAPRDRNELPDRLVEI